ncbi:hypothetical protein [Ekhidna sp.]
MVEAIDNSIGESQEDTGVNMVVAPVDPDERKTITVKLSTLKQCIQLIRKEFDHSHWAVADQWIDIAEDLGEREAAEEMKLNLMHG